MGEISLVGGTALPDEGKASVRFLFPPRPDPDEDWDDSCNDGVEADVESKAGEKPGENILLDSLRRKSGEMSSGTVRPCGRCRPLAFGDAVGDQSFPSLLLLVLLLSVEFRGGTKLLFWLFRPDRRSSPVTKKRNCRKKKQGSGKGAVRE